ncbi:MAG: hypothetical protein A2705_00590 [Omnitrophica WOR_2 bacterium RIFCSPHIGHO2_01_FULL_52_10]|nr:MAG: hypothetical protein A2705_00590 [Omnitrophica WOR_2 bacterium RIFCSPHIGHO2_01_FULL_52_10]
MLVLVTWYVALTAAHYFNQRPMWNDEACVFESIQYFNPQQMFTAQLRAVQVFPRVYLFLIQQFSGLFDFHLLSLRFFSFVAMLAAFWLWLKLVRPFLKNDWAYWTYLFSWSASVPLVYYAAELKSYSVDVLAGAIFMTFLYHEDALHARDARQYRLVLAALPALGLFSYPAFLFAMIVLYNLIVATLKDRSRRNDLLIYAVSLAAFILLSYTIDIRLRPVGAVTEGFGDYFISTQSVGEFFKTLGEGTNNLFSRWFGEKPKTVKRIAIMFILFGFFNMFYAFFANIKKEGYRIRSPKTAAFALFLGLVALGLLKKYPFTVPRTSLFFCPFALFLTIEAITGLKKFNKYIFSPVHGLYVVFLIAVTFGIASNVFSGDLGAVPILWK